MDSFKEYLLTEKTFALGQDVDFIYNQFFKRIVDLIQKGKWKGETPTVFKIGSSKLKSRDAKKAHKIKPIVIRMGGGGGETQNSYDPLNNEIFLSFSMDAMSALLNVDNKQIKNLKNVVHHSNLKTIHDELSTMGLKTTIYHELAHWVDDSVHNQHLYKTASKAYQKASLGGTDKDVKKQMRGKYSAASSIATEVNSQIHEIKQRKRMIGKKEWDKLTFGKLINMSSGLNYVRDETKNANEFDLWKKHILKRMAREGLLGKSMKYKRGYDPISSARLSTKRDFPNKEKIKQHTINAKRKQELNNMINSIQQMMGMGGGDIDDLMRSFG